MNLWLIPIFRDKGAAIATVFGEIVVSFIAFYFVHKKMKLRFKWSLVVKAFLASLLFIPISLLLKDFISNIIIRLGVGILSCSMVYFSIQIFMFRESLIRGVYQDVIEKIRINVKR